ncbi:hypothetical protein ACOSQ2_003164 [Xanthoceras sorbifolium]
MSKLDDSSGALSAAAVAKETLKDRVTDGKMLANEYRVFPVKESRLHGALTIPEAQGKAEGENLCPSPPSSASSGQPNDSSYEELANDFDFHPCPGTNASRLYLLGPDRPLPVAGDYPTTGPESSSSHPIVSVPSSPPSG